jgi:transcriptional regulator with XRE-family HTH domain
MPHSRLNNYLQTERLRSGFSQRELAELLGVSKSALTKAEGTGPPSRKLLVMTEMVFGSSQRELYPDLYAQLERRLLVRALTMDDRLIGTDNPVARRKRAFLGELIKRANANSHKL